MHTPITEKSKAEQVKNNMALRSCDDGAVDIVYSELEIFEYSSLFMNQITSAVRVVLQEV